MTSNYTANDGLMDLVLATQNNPARGTNVNKMVIIGHNQLGSKIPDTFVSFVVDYQNNLFGNYPDHRDLAPSIIFTVVFIVILILHSSVFIINFSRGHFFWPSVLWIFYSVLRIIGWVLRYVWALDITRTLVGISSEVFLIIPNIILITSNLILAQRLFTWRHPVGGSRKLFTNVMYGHYVIVLGVIGMTVACAAIPYVHFLSQSSYDSYKSAVKASSILIIGYTLSAISLIALSYFFKPTTKDENLYTYQPWWIESFHPFYFVKPHAAQIAEETFMKRNHNHRHAIRVIAATHHHYKMVKGLTNQRGNLTHNKSLGIIFVSTVLLFICAVGRAVTVFQGRYKKDSSPACAPVFAYICWGLFEVIINAMFIIGRVDLRFYRPDILPQKVRSIITAEQSFLPSVLVSEVQSVESWESSSERTPSAPTYHSNPTSEENQTEKFESSPDDGESNFHF